MVEMARRWYELTSDEKAVFEYIYGVGDRSVEGRLYDIEQWLMSLSKRSLY